MKKGRMSNILQRGFILCCVMLVAMTVVFTRGNEAKASKGKTNSCSLQSITLEIDGEEHKFEGELEPFIVEKDKDWSEFLSTIKIADFEVVTDDVCTCEGGHSSLKSDLLSGSIIAADFVTYADGTSTNILTKADKEVTINDSFGYFSVLFTTDGGSMEIYFVKEYSLTYELDGGAFPEGMEVPDKYYSYKYGDLPIPEREGYIFTGWTCAEGEEPVVQKGLYRMAGDLTCTAHWIEGERTDISSFYVEIADAVLSRQYEGKEITPDVEGVYYLNEGAKTYLTQGTDYTVTYKNNIEVADTNSETPPTIIIRGVGVYKGSIEKKFTITKAGLSIHSGSIVAIEGTKLSDADLSSLVVCNSALKGATDEIIKVVSGTWEWSKPDTVVARTDDNAYSLYTATFTPDEEKHYDNWTTDIWVTVKKSVDNCMISFEDEDTFVYTGEAYMPDITVMYGENKLYYNEDYEVTYVNNVNAGDKTDEKAPTVVVKGIGDYAGNKQLTFTIEKATPSIATAPKASVIEEGQKLSDSTLTGGKVLDIKGNALEGEFSWKDGAIMPALADSGVTKYTVVFTPKDTANYKTVEIEVVVKVNAASSEDGSADGGATAQPQVGDKTTDKANKATYQVTKSAEGKVEVAYVAPTSKTKTVSIPATVTLADGTAAKVTSIAAKAFKSNTKVQTVTIGKNVKTIGKEVFSGCKNLKKVKSASNVTSIGKSAFANCKKLTSVAMSSKVTTIGEKAFYNCKALAKITIPKNVKSIGKSAFQGCKKLKSITISTKKLTKKNVGKNAFKGIPSKAKINVPNSKVKSYKSILRAKGVSKKATIK